MAEIKKRIPKRRFKEFWNAGDWEESKLGDLSDSFEYGLNAAAKEFDGKNKYIRITDIDEDSRLYLNTGVSSPNIDLSSADNFKLKYGDILFARTGASVGKSYIYKVTDGLVYYAGFLIRARIKNIYNPEFVFYSTLTDGYKDFIRVSSQRSGQPGVNAQEYSTYSIKVPKEDEQSKIGNHFKTLDNLITLHQRKLVKIKSLKKAYLSEMFPAKGESKPKRRFKGFSGDWEEREVTDLLKNSSTAMKIGPFGSALKKEYYVDKGIKVYAQENTFTGDFTTGDYYISEEKYRELKSCELFPGDLVISMMGTVGACAIFPDTAEKGIMNSHLLRVQFASNINSEYIMFLLRDSDLIRKQIDRLSVGSIMSGLSSSVVKKLVFPIPKIEEQERLVEFMRSIENFITLHQQKLDKLKNLKKSYLNEMFV